MCAPALALRERAAAFWVRVPPMAAAAESSLSSKPDTTCPLITIDPGGSSVAAVEAAAIPSRRPIMVPGWPMPEVSVEVAS